MPITTVCPGSFDPPTEGHINIIERATKIFGKVIVAVSVNSKKKGTFSTRERIALLNEIFKGRKGIEIDSFEGRLLVDYVKSKKAQVILKGLRTIEDYEYEFQMALANKQIAPEIETVFMMAASKYSHISSSLIKEIISLGGPGRGMVSKIVEKRLNEKFKSRV